jgi:hypothetical protein
MLCQHFANCVQEESEYGGGVWHPGCEEGISSMTKMLMARKGFLYAVLADIALRLDPAPCSQAQTERAIGNARRILMPHQTQTKTDVLLARKSIGCSK